MMPMPIDRPLVAAGVAALIVSASTTSLVVNESATITSGKDPDWQSGIFKKVGLDVTLGALGGSATTAAVAPARRGC
jgi:hypothetical protein